MSQRTYTGLTTSLTVMSIILILGSIVALRTDWLQHADFFVQFAVFPGGLIAGGIVFLSLWYHYDDCKDHLAGLSKQEWDYFQRLILLLESDAEIERVRQRRWSVRQVVAGIGLIGFGLCVVRFGIGWHLFGFALLFGPISILLSYWRNHSERRQDDEQLRLSPFSSFSELRAIRRSVPGFSKRTYPAGAKVRRIRSRLMTMTGWLQTAVLWSFISPLILLFQTLPEKKVKTRIRQEAT